MRVLGADPLRRVERFLRADLPGGFNEICYVIRMDFMYVKEEPECILGTASGDFVLHFSVKTWVLGLIAASNNQRRA